MPVLSLQAPCGLFPSALRSRQLREQAWSFFSQCLLSKSFPCLLLAQLLPTPPSGLSFKLSSWHFPGGAVVENPPANAGEMGSSPGPGRSHMPRSN